ncbi:hypothetical protein [Mogibacterium sp.]|uniref:hypothetical protein n=1 Tax=Mogibacterium sp. TaxID=2049035 RepID=UPI00257C1444|nr:hypothetical protein [Mogibacterium sp.]
MNQIILGVKLCEENADGDILSFQFEDGEGKVHLNSDSCQMQMKNVFSKLIKLSLESDVILDFQIAEGYCKGLYKDVCNEYVQALQKELDEVKENIRQEIAEKNSMLINCLYITYINSHIKRNSVDENLRWDTGW